MPDMVGFADGHYRGPIAAPFAVMPLATLTGSSRQESAIDDEFRSRNEACVVANEISNSCGELGRVRSPTEGCLRHHAAFRFGGVDGGVHTARYQCIHSDPIRSKFEGGGPGEPEEPSFARRIRGVPDGSGRPKD